MILLKEPMMARMSLSIIVKYQKLTNSHRSEEDNGCPLYSFRKSSVFFCNLGWNGSETVRIRGKALMIETEVFHKHKGVQKHCYLKALFKERRQSIMESALTQMHVTSKKIRRVLMISSS